MFFHLSMNREVQQILYPILIENVGSFSHFLQLSPEKALEDNIYKNIILIISLIKNNNDEDKLTKSISLDTVPYWYQNNKIDSKAQTKQRLVDVVRGLIYINASAEDHYKKLVITTEIDDRLNLQLILEVFQSLGIQQMSFSVDDIEKLSTQFPSDDFEVHLIDLYISLLKPSDTLGRCTLIESDVFKSTEDGVNFMIAMGKFSTLFKNAESREKAVRFIKKWKQTLADPKDVIEQTGAGHAYYHFPERAQDVISQIVLPLLKHGYIELANSFIKKPLPWIMVRNLFRNLPLSGAYLELSYALKDAQGRVKLDTITEKPADNSELSLVKEGIEKYKRVLIEQLMNEVKQQLEAEDGAATNGEKYLTLYKSVESRLSLASLHQLRMLKQILKAEGVLSKSFQKVFLDQGRGKDTLALFEKTGSGMMVGVRESLEGVIINEIKKTSYLAWERLLEERTEDGRALVPAVRLLRKTPMKDVVVRGYSVYEGLTLQDIAFIYQEEYAFENSNGDRADLVKKVKRVLALRKVDSRPQLSKLLLKLIDRIDQLRDRLYEIGYIHGHPHNYNFFISFIEKEYLNAERERGETINTIAPSQHEHHDVLRYLEDVDKYEVVVRIGDFDQLRISSDIR